ncbi:MAG: iron ABC transporter permease [Candidatus Methanomethylophilaceae archaeon]|nr:iron ABC transporter permease [Candidatus Methanomethylophilaceae archaeon]
MTWDAFLKRSLSLRRRKVAFISAMAAILAIMLVASPALGAYEVSAADVFRIIVSHLMGNPSGDRTDFVVWDVRLTSSIMAVITGFALGVCGSVMQAVMRNPLADPYTMGVSSGASLGAVLSLVMGISLIPGLTGDASVVTNAFLLSLVPMAVILTLSIARRMTDTMMILCGIGVMYFFSASTSLMMLYADPTQMSAVYSWNLGNIGIGYWDNLPTMAVPTAVCTAFLIVCTPKIDILTSGDDLSHTVGVDPFRLRVYASLAVSVMIAAIVSFTGTIGFIGLIAPHISRAFVGSKQAFLIPASGLVGAAMLLAANDAARVLGSLPVGVITTLVGCPLFFALLIRRRRSQWV